MYSLMCMACVWHVQARLDEIAAARRTLSRRGVPGVRALIAGRQVSSSLRTYLEKLL